MTFKSNIQKELTTCPVCNNENGLFLYKGREHEYSNTTDDLFSCYKCPNCLCWYLNPRPVLSELSTIYPLNYYAYSVKRQSVQNLRNPKTLYSQIGKKKHKKRYLHIIRNIPITSETCWFEIGCAQGNNLDFIKDTFKCKTAGIELSQKSVEVARSKGHDVIQGNFEIKQFENNKYDIISSSHLIEHLSSPRYFLEKIYPMLKFGGYCIIDTPNTDTWEARFLKQYWGGWHFPRHWALLCAKSINILGTLTNFDIVNINYSTNGAFWGWSFHCLLVQKFKLKKLADFLFPSDDRMNNPGIFNIMKMICFTSLDIINGLLAGKTSNMQIILQKK